MLSAGEVPIQSPIEVADVEKHPPGVACMSAAGLTDAPSILRPRPEALRGAGDLIARSQSPPRELPDLGLRLALHADLGEDRHCALELLHRLLGPVSGVK